MNYKVGQKIRLKDWDRVSGQAKQYADETVTISEVDTDGYYWIRPEGGKIFSVWDNEILFLDENEPEAEETYEIGEMVEVRDDDDENWFLRKYEGMAYSVTDNRGRFLVYDQIRKFEPKVEIDVYLNGEEQELSETLITLIKRELAG